MVEPSLFAVAMAAAFSIRSNVERSSFILVGRSGAVDTSIQYIPAETPTICASRHKQLTSVPTAAQDVRQRRAPTPTTLFLLAALVGFRFLFCKSDEE